MTKPGQNQHIWYLLVSKTPDLQKCEVLYQITCSQCQRLYVGEAGRTRIKDHTSHNTQPTAVGDHCRDHGHVISMNNVEVLAREEGRFKLKDCEAITIKIRHPTVNRDQGFDLPAIYSLLLPIQRVRHYGDRQSSDHSPMSSGQLACLPKWT